MLGLETVLKKAKTGTRKFYFLRLVPVSSEFNFFGNIFFGYATNDVDRSQPVRVSLRTQWSE